MKSLFGFLEGDYLTIKPLRMIKVMIDDLKFVLNNPA